MYLNSINYFRAIAIMFIVAGHCLSLSDFSFHSFFGDVILNIMTGGTTFFVFISGFLFYHVFYKNFNFYKFIKTKVKFVLFPYIIMSFFPVMFYVFIGHHVHKYFEPIGDGIVNLYIIPLIKYYFTGIGIVAYWYIPFVMLIFLMSPVFISFIRLNLKSQLLIIFPLLLISTLIHRPIEGSGYVPIHALAYFIPVYLIGIISSQNKTFIYSTLKGKGVHLFILGIFIAIIGVVFGQVESSFKHPFVYEGFDLMLIQKLILCFAFMIWLGQFEKDKNKFLNLISENSFGIFFLHPLLLILTDKTKRMLDFTFPENVLLIYLIFYITIFTLSLGITILIKRIFPAHSRYIVGS